ncbi:MAG TPA: hypothetical protein VFR43_13665 [Gaiellaceae bacterium]|nr:hypothetical protein [Gaiellaceae bacterium]
MRERVEAVRDNRVLLGAAVDDVAPGETRRRRPKGKLVLVP